MENNDSVIEIIQDHAAMRASILMIMDTIETKDLPKYSYVPSFNDSMIEEEVISCLELASGKKYD